MSELDLRDINLQNSGYPIKMDYSLIQLDLYRLLCCFCASKSIYEISNKYSNSLINTFLRIEYEKSEISRIILNLAIIARNELDNNNQFRIDNIDDQNDSVGDLYCYDSGIKKVLTFREACNKIIHCNYINWDLDNAVSTVKYDFLNPSIYIYGTHNTNDWKATIRIYDFINVYTNLIQL